ncbi:uncharacterized protein BO97DRAFT_157813 [Aspergillus homomorphus CBS 101889]|uniref:Uncharacterized protein n=1 Tax=Aspergillus homomorphus (strain CBS 101889) TaxID=1450537 RepID=A0A395HQI4_ASPHC|nr:hypothetical protein BO97DRAFT_157813 [Aspergillus homomorphus CBS 101889]RAL09693.1 hypothetical protein BO97DRAFT_157813 [Aspergillus homomorphus CBS 101889]
MEGDSMFPPLGTLGEEVLALSVGNSLRGAGDSLCPCVSLNGGRTDDHKSLLCYVCTAESLPGKNVIILPPISIVALALTHSRWLPTMVGFRTCSRTRQDGHPGLDFLDLASATLLGFMSSSGPPSKGEVLPCATWVVDHQCSSGSWPSS